MNRFANRFVADKIAMCHKGKSGALVLRLGFDRAFQFGHGAPHAKDDRQMLRGVRTQRLCQRFFQAASDQHHLQRRGNDRIRNARHACVAFDEHGAALGFGG